MLPLVTNSGLWINSDMILLNLVFGLSIINVSFFLKKAVQFSRMCFAVYIMHDWGEPGGHVAESHLCTIEGCMGNTSINIQQITIKR